MAEVEVTVQAYTKMVLHAAKYPHRAVCGLLLGDKRAPDLERVSLVDAVPLFHVALPLAPMLEVALTQLDIWCKEHDLVIAGYYQVNENQHDTMANPVAFRTAERVAINNGTGLLVMLENEGLGSRHSRLPLKVYKYNEGKWSLKDNSFVVTEADCMPVSEALIRSGAYLELSDFDNHLDDLRRDWANDHVNRMILDSC